MLIIISSTIDVPFLHFCHLVKVELFSATCNE